MSSGQKLLDVFVDPVSRGRTTRIRYPQNLTLRSRGIRIHIVDPQGQKNRHVLEPNLLTMIFEASGGGYSFPGHFNVKVFAKRLN
jgi:hypothetical protein